MYCPQTRLAMARAKKGLSAFVTQSANATAPLRRFRYNKDQKVFVLVKQFNAGSGFGGGVLVSGK